MQLEAGEGRVIVCYQPTDPRLLHRNDAYRPAGRRGQDASRGEQLHTEGGAIIGDEHGHDVPFFQAPSPPRVNVCVPGPSARVAPSLPGPNSSVTAP